MSEHRHRRRRRSSGFDLVRLYEDDHHVLDEFVHEKRHVLAGWAVMATAGFFGILLALLVLVPRLWEERENWTANLPGGTAYITYPPDGAVEELGGGDSAGGLVQVSGALSLLLMIATIIVAGLHIASGRNAAGEGADEVRAAQPVAEPSAFRQRLDELVCINMSRRPQTRSHRHHH